MGKGLNKSKRASLRRNILAVWDNRRIMMGTGLAHFTHDGFADMLYVFFPLWQTPFGLAFAQVGLFKMLFSGTLVLFQVPCRFLARRVVFLDAYHALRADLGQAILLGLELLVIADIINTVTIEPTLQNLGVLAIIIAIWTCLSFPLELEVSGHWPWQRVEAKERHSGGES
jgi:uncharacterized membrane protein